jgi:hypothetical protein
LNGNGYFNGRSGKSFVSDEDEVENENINNNKQIQDFFNSTKLTRHPWNNNSHADDVIQFTQLSNAVEGSGRSSRSSRSLSNERFPVQQQQHEDDHTRESSSSSSAALHASTGLESTPGNASPPSEDHFPTTVYKAPHGTMPFLFTQPNHIYYPVTESEKLKKMRAGKERKEKLIKKNVKETYTVAGAPATSDYNVETILESLGENGNPSSDEKKSKKSNKPVYEASSKRKPTEQAQPQLRKRSNGKEGEARRRSSVDESEDVSDASKEAETERDDSDVETSAKVKLDKSRSEDSTSATPKPAETNSYRNNSDIKDLIGFSGKFVTVNQPESGGSDLKRQTSKSTENLSSFTEVTKKRDRKKKSPITDDSHDYRSGQQQIRPPQPFESRRFNVNGSQQRGRPESASAAASANGQQSHISSGSSTASQESSRSSSTQPAPSNGVPLNKFLASGARPNPPPAFSRPAPSQPGQQKNGLDLSSSDFPPLEAEEGAASAASGPAPATAPAWPLSRPAASAFFTASPPSGAASTSDHSAVISKTETRPEDEDDPSDSSSVKTLVPGGEWSATSLLSSGDSSSTLVPPDVTKDAGLAGGSARQFSLPDIAAGAPLGSVSSGECTPPCAGSEKPSSHSDYAECFDREGASSSRHSTASFFVDVDNNVEIVLTEEEYNIRRLGGYGGGELCAPVVILGKGETPLEDWTSSSGFEFGFDLNDALLMSSSTSSVPSTLAGEDLQQQPHQQPLLAGHQPLDHIDDAIVKFGAPMAFHPQNPHGHYFDMANWHQQHMAAFSQLHASEADEDVASGKSTPKAVQIEAVEGKASTEATTKAGKQRLRSDFVETVVAINRRWEHVASELKSKAAGVVYFVPDSAQKAVA